MRRAMFDCDITGDMYTLLDQAFLRMASAFRTRQAG
jgi:hemoglobin